MSEVSTSLAKVRKLIEEREREYPPSRNKVRWYLLVIPTENGECRLNYYAVRTDEKKKEIVVKHGFSFWSDRRYYFVKSDVIQLYFSSGGQHVTMDFTDYGGQRGKQ